MAAVPNIILQPIRALKLAPGDTLLIHFDKKPTDAQLAELSDQLTAELWGKQNTFVVLYGKFNPMTTNSKCTPPPQS